jgi:broad specificity phosphatase PhoE
MPPLIVMLVRHAEKQPDDPPPFGINEDGSADKHSLTARGWQRAGALVEFFASPSLPIVSPDVIYATAVDTSESVGDDSKSLRPQETVTPLARRLGLSLKAPFVVGQEAALAKKIESQTGFVLVAWEHKHIPLIAAALKAKTPTAWPEDRFDLVWLLTRGDRGYKFRAVPQLLLDGDAPVSENAPE